MAGMVTSIPLDCPRFGCVCMSSCLFMCVFLYVCVCVVVLVTAFGVCLSVLSTMKRRDKKHTAPGHGAIRPFLSPVRSETHSNSTANIFHTSSRLRVDATLCAQSSPFKNILNSKESGDTTKKKERKKEKTRKEMTSCSRRRIEWSSLRTFASGSLQCSLRDMSAATAAAAANAGAEVKTTAGTNFILFFFRWSLDVAAACSNGPLAPLRRSCRF